MRCIIINFVIVLLLSVAQQAFGQCNFTVSSTTPCGGVPVNFTGTGTAGNYSWDFDDDGNIDAYGLSASFTYPTLTYPNQLMVRLYKNGVSCHASTIQVQPSPDASIGLVPGVAVMEGNSIRTCTSIPNVDLKIFNASSTYNSNNSYTINWGDGITENFTNSTFSNASTLSHSYNGFGFYEIVVDVESGNGCSASETYTFYNGGNPSVGLATPGNTTGLCAPATVDFPITNTNNNPTGTIYQVYVSGVLVASYTQDNVPASFVYTFDESSCGLTTSTGNYSNAYDVQVVASNPCGSSQATIEPIEVSDPPELVLGIGSTGGLCVNEEYTFSDQSSGLGEVISGNCSGLPASWSITPGVPGVHWVITGGNMLGSEQLQVTFLIPGDYEVEMIVNSQSCGSFSTVESFTVDEGSDISISADLATAASPAAETCIPSVATFQNNSTGDGLSYAWNISPTNGWEFLDTFSAASKNLEVQFNAPGDYQVSLWATNSCATETWDTVFTILAPPEIMLENLAPFCDEATLNLDDTKVMFNAHGGTFTSFQWSFPGGSPSSSNDKYPTGIYYNSTGLKTITVTATNECGSFTASNTFIIQKQGQVSVSDDVAICVSADAFTLAGYPAGGVWSGNGVSADGEFTPDETNIGNNILTYNFDENNCVLEGTMVVTVEPGPTIDAGDDQLACIGDASFLITGGNPSGGTWSVDNGGVIVGNNVFDVSTSGTGIYTLTYSYADTDDCGGFDTKTIIVNDLPEAKAGLDQTVCLSAKEHTLTGYTPSGGTWTGMGVTSDGIFSASNTLGEGTYELYYTFTDANTQCSDTDTMLMTVTPTILIDAGEDEVICITNNAFTISAGNPLGGTWTGQGIIDPSGIFDPSVAGVGGHVLEYKIGNDECSPFDTKLIVVKDLPNIHIPVQPSACLNEPNIDLSATTPTGGVWSGAGIVGNEFDPSNAGVGTHTITYSINDITSGCSNSKTFTINVFALPELKTTDTSYCHTPGLFDLPQATPAGGTWTGDGVINNRFDAIFAGGVGVYYLTYTFSDQNNCESSVTSIVEVTAAPNVNAGNDLELCIDGNTIDLSTIASPPNGTWTSNGSLGLNGTTFDPNIAGTGEHTLTYSVGIDDCIFSDDIVIKVNNLPYVNVGADIEVCVSETALVLTAIPSGGKWSSLNGAVIQGNLFDAMSSGVGTYSLSYTYKDDKGCENSDDLLVEVLPLPILEVNDTTYCITQGAVDLPIAEPEGGSWSGQGVVNDIFYPKNSGGPGTVVLTYSYISDQGCESSVTSTVEIEAAPNVDAGDDLELCIDGNAIDLAFIASPPNGTWTSNGSTGLNGFTFDPNIAGTGEHTLTYTVENANCISSDDIVIKVNNLPYVNVGADIEVCVSENTFALTAIPSGGLWSGGNGAVMQGNLFSPKSSGVGLYNLTYTYTDTKGCKNSDDILIEVLPLPNLEVNDTTYCIAQGAVDLPTAMPQGGTWSGEGVVNNIFYPQNAGGAGILDLTYTFISDQGCESSVISEVALVAPVQVFAGENKTVCIDQGLIDLSENISPPNGTWDANGSDGLFGNVFNPTIAGAGQHVLTYVVGEGSCQGKDEVVIIVNPLPEIFAGEDLSLCVNEDPFALEGQNPTGGTWSGVGITNPITGTFNPEVAEVGDHVLTYHYKDPNTGCKNSTTRSITVLPMEIPAFELPQKVCVGEDVNIVNNSSTDLEVSWDFGDGGMSMEFSPQHTYTAAGIYEVKLSVENSNGCAEYVTKKIKVTGKPTAYFTPNTKDACVGLELSLSNQSSGENLSYHWDFGDDQTSTQKNPDIIYLEQGVGDTTYIVTLTVTNECGSHSYQDLITIHPKPISNIGLSPQTECSPLVMEFANISTGSPTNYEWDFGNGNFSTDALPPTQTYIAEENTTYYTVTLVTTNVCGKDTATAEIEVDPPNVKALFEPSDVLGCVPMTVDFTNYATATATIDWNFGDGNTSSLPSPSHTFDSAGVYTVTQFAFGYCGYDTEVVTITVLPPPDVSFTHPVTVCKDAPVTFENLSVGTTGNFWDFGDGNTSELNQPMHIYKEPGVYTVTLKGVLTNIQCPATYTSTITVLDIPTATFDISGTNGCVPYDIQLTNTSEGTVYYEWDFGDGNTSTDENPSHTYETAGNYQVTFIATDNNGCYNDTTVTNILVHPQPTAAFDFSRASLCGLPAEINFKNQSDNASGYLWQFGDGASSTLTDPKFIYDEPGTFNVILTATNQFGCEDVSIRNLTIHEMPKAIFELENTEGCTPLDVSFINNSTTATEYFWDFGDGNTSTQQYPQHTYYQEGNFDVMLIASVNGECFDTMIYEGAVTAHPTPIANFMIDPNSVNANDGYLQMLNLSEGGNEYYWEFSDGQTSTELNPGHQFLVNGNKQIFLEVKNEYGCVDDTLVNVTPKTIKGLYLGNAFSPEQGIGDVRVFKAVGVGIKEFHLQVFSPYGQLLWETQSLDEGIPDESWDGTVGGKLLPQDVYVWKCYALFDDGTVWQGMPKKNGGYQRMGSVTLLR